jgi:hypothetical protein
MDIIISRDRPIFKTKVTFKDKSVVEVECNEWPEVRDGWVIIVSLDKYKVKAGERHYYKKEDILGLTSVFIAPNEITDKI